MSFSRRDSSRPIRRGVASLLLFCVASLLPGLSTAQSPELPEVLQPWKSWVLWDAENPDCPKLFNDSATPICFWASRLELVADQDGGSWKTEVEVFDESWVALPGAEGVWPINVRDGEDPLVVVSRDGRPAVKLPVGVAKLSGEFRWKSMPQRISIPKTIGVISLVVDGEPVRSPSWDANGEVWLRRVSRQAADKDVVNVQVYRVIEDGIPLWLRTEIELTVSGKSREEPLGSVMPEGWSIATVESEIPVAIDDRGVAKAQVRAGKWTIAIDAFRTTDPERIEYAAEAEPIVDQEWVGLKTDPNFRVAQIEDLKMVDVTQTTFPAKWRELPIYLWDTSGSFRLVEKMRGMGQKSPTGLAITRRFWLDEDGQAMTYQDVIRGENQQRSRLDVAEGSDLGAVRIDGQGQLITLNPNTGATGVEIRKRDLRMEAIGRLDRTPELLATGWQADADELRMTFTLPPGWRVFAVWNADQVIGDWLTAWTLLDLFLLLVFAIAVGRLFGIIPGLIALAAFGLAYHEPGSPRFTWFFLLIPVAILRVVPEGTGTKLLSVWKNVAIGLLLLSLIPFVIVQTQSAIYPQLERSGTVYGSRNVIEWFGGSFAAQSQWDRMDSASYRSEASTKQSRSKFQVSNLLYDPTSKIQTGPAQPQWEWNNVTCVWNGPVTEDQRLRPVLISVTQRRVLVVVNVALLALLAAILLGVRTIPWLRKRGPGKDKAVANAVGAVAVGAWMLLVPTTASAQFPDAKLLEEMRQRLTETPDAFPNAAEIPTLDLSIDGNTIEMRAEIHAAADVAVPLPGRLPSWSPISVTMDDDPNVLLVRRDDYLWLRVPKGVHQVTVKGMLPDSGQWEWTFLLKPRQVTIDAAGWKVNGIGSNGVPAAQVLLVKEQDLTSDQAAYDRAHFNPVVVVDRYLEIGLIAKVRNTVTRLSEPGKAISLQVPLLAGESVLTANRDVSDDTLAVNMGADQMSFSWESELPLGADIQLTAEPSGRWVERWHLIASPIWNFSHDGLTPIYQPNEEDLIPTWNPWPGESVTLTFSKPVPASGDVLTVQKVNQETTLGSRRRTGELTVDLECSLASDFVIELDPEAEIVSLTIDERPMPVQRDGGKLIVPARPGKQTLQVKWKIAKDLETVQQSDRVILPVEASNITSTMIVPDSRWVLWADGPLRGPAVRFWTILVIAIFTALVLGSFKLSPLRRWEWFLLTLGLTQLNIAAAMLVVGWLFLLAWRGNGGLDLSRWRFRILQIGLVMVTFWALGALMAAVGEGLLGSPDMFILGNGSSRTALRWFQPRCDASLPVTSIVSVSLWFYRVIMLAWALWLAMSLLKWLTWGWKQATAGGGWR